MLNRGNYNDLYAFLLVAREKSFTKAANKLGVSQSALSRIIKSLEQQLGMRLFTRTTRSISLTQVGEQLFSTAEQSFERLDRELTMLGHLRDMPSGLVRITASQLAIDQILLPKLASFTEDYPNIQIELISDATLTNIVSERFDAGVRFGNFVEDGMIAVRIGENEKIVVVGSPEYFAKYGFPKSPRDLNAHQCIGYRNTSGVMYDWLFWQNGKSIEIKTQGQWVFSSGFSIRDAAKLGLGLGYIPRSLVKKELESGELIQVLTEFSDELKGFYLYYPDRNISYALKCVIDYLRI